MSFSREVKEEMAGHIPKMRHCMIAELAAMVSFGIKSRDFSKEELFTLSFTEGVVHRKYFTLLSKTLNIEAGVLPFVEDTYRQAQQMLKLSSDMQQVDPLVYQQTCCKRSFIRGAFLAAGSISDPTKGYHFEIVCASMAQAKSLIAVMNTFEDIEAKEVFRNGRYVVYLKEGSQIVEALGIMEAPHSVMELENIRIVKEVRGNINRKVNCETANITKTVGAAVRQINDIQLIADHMGLEKLSPQLQEIALVRLDNPDTPLQELGQLLDKPIGKSGVNHRLKKLAQIADSIRVASADVL